MFKSLYLHLLAYCGAFLFALPASAATTFDPPPLRAVSLTRLKAELQKIVGCDVWKKRHDGKWGCASKVWLTDVVLTPDANEDGVEMVEMLIYLGQSTSRDFDASRPGFNKADYAPKVRDKALDVVAHLFPSWSDSRVWMKGAIDASLYEQVRLIRDESDEYVVIVQNAEFVELEDGELRHNNFDNEGIFASVIFIPRKWLLTPSDKISLEKLSSYYWFPDGLALQRLSDPDTIKKDFPPSYRLYPTCGPGWRQCSESKK